MMKIDHIALFVADLERAKNFWMKYFDAKPNELYHNPRTGLKTYILSLDGEARVEIMSRPDVQPSTPDIPRMGYAHVSVSLGSKERVDAMTEWLRADGYAIVSGPRTTGDGYYETCFTDGEGNQIEITV